MATIHRNLRDGSVIFPTDPLRQTEFDVKLTDEEVERIYRERRLYYNMEDIRTKLEGMLEEYEGEPEFHKIKDILENDELIRDLAERFDHALDNNDSFMESFWMTAENVILDEVEEV